MAHLLQASLSTHRFRKAICSLGPGTRVSLLRLMSFKSFHARFLHPWVYIPATPPLILHVFLGVSLELARGLSCSDVRASVLGIL